jgi:tetratricopeptide (TPR) repeat protein
MIFKHAGSSDPARIAILGPCGYGKTTLANAVLTHQQVQEHFGGDRHFVACESVFSPDALLIELAKTLGLLNQGRDDLLRRICDALGSKDCIICLDNFESPWDQVEDEDGHIKGSVEELLAQISSLQHTTLLITMRGIVRPRHTKWTKPFLLPLMSLDSDAARKIWEDTVDNYDSFAGKLLKAVDYVPLAVSLLAHLAQSESPEMLLKGWNEKQTEFIQRDAGDRAQKNKLSNLEYSIRLSIDSGRMRNNTSAKEMLGVLSMLPDGMHVTLIKRWKSDLCNVDISSGLSTLQACGLIPRAEGKTQKRYQTYPIIRNFCNHQTSYALVSQEHRDAIRLFYLKLASFQPHKVEAKHWIILVQQVNNTKAILFDLLKSDFSDQKKLIQAICTFTSFHSSIGDYSDKLISQTAEFLQQKNDPVPLLISCLQQWGLLYYDASKLEKAKEKIKEAENLCKAHLDNSSQHARTFHILGKICLQEDNILGAEGSFHKALEIYKQSNDILGQGIDYGELGTTYLRLNELCKAETFYQTALEKLENDVLGQGNVYLGLGTIYLRQNKLDEAKVSYQRALKFHKHANDMQGQANDYEQLGHIYALLNQQNEAYNLFERALRLYRHAKNSLGQGNGYVGLGDIHFSLNELKEAEALYQKALSLYELSKDDLKQESTLQKLGQVERARLQLQDTQQASL